MRILNTNFLAGAAGASQRFMNLEDDLKNKQFQAAQFGANLGLQNRAMRQNVVNALVQTQIAKNPGINPMEIYNFVDKGVTSLGNINEKYFSKEAPKLEFKNAINTNPGITGKDALTLGLQSGIDPKELPDILKQNLLQRKVVGNPALFGGVNSNIALNNKGQLVNAPARFDAFIAALQGQPLQPTPFSMNQMMPNNVSAPSVPQGGW